MPRLSTNIIDECALDLAMTRGEIMSIATTAPKRYYVWQVAKKSRSGFRTISHPARELKTIQRYFSDSVLNVLPVHECATAYVKGSSIAKNARVHVNSRVILKLDFSNFFPSIIANDWKNFASDHFSDWSDEEVDFSCRILFWGNGSYIPKCLAIGAPSPPSLSNALLYDFDKSVSEFAQENSYRYTRYADDLTFSTKGFLDAHVLIQYVKTRLKSSKYTNISLNDQKTVIASRKSSMKVTGLNITPDHKISIGRQRKRNIRAMVNSARKGLLSSGQNMKLAGLLAFCSDVEPEFLRSLQTTYSEQVVDKIMNKNAV